MKALDELIQEKPGEVVSAYYFGGGLMLIEWDDDYCIIDDDDVRDVLGQVAYCAARVASHFDPALLILVDVRKTVNQHDAGGYRIER